MMNRKPLEYGVIEDAETAIGYNRAAQTRTQFLSKSFTFMARRWSITDGRVLDVGTGTGLLAIEFARSIPGVEVVGLDLSDAVLELARDNAQESEVSSRVSFRKGDVEDIPLGDDAFDLVISCNTLH